LHHALAQLVSREPRTLLAGIEDVADAERAALIGILHHGAGIVGRHDRQIAVADAAERELAGVGHRARVERRDLVVVLVGAAEEGRRELAGHLHDVRGVDAGRLEPAPIFAEVLAGRRHEKGALAEQGQGVRDVRRAAAAPLVHRVHEEAQADAVDVLRQQVLGEPAGKRHQVIEGNRSGNNESHGRSDW
jgi:hypothetical protein